MPESDPNGLQTGEASPLARRIGELDQIFTTKLADAVPTNTRRAYGSDRADWAAFCDQVNVDPLPVDEYRLALYITDLLENGSPSVATHRRRPLAASTAERRLSAIVTYAQEHGYPAPNQRAARKVIAGHRAKHRVRPRRATAVDPAQLHALVEAARAQESSDGRPLSYRRSRDACMLLVHWDLMLRRSELAALTLGDIQWHPRGMEVAVRRTKTTSEEEWKAVHYRSNPALCAVRAVRVWTDLLAQAGHTSQDTPLICRLPRAHTLPTTPQPLSGHSVNEVIKKMAARAGLSRTTGPAQDAPRRQYTGHSLRRGPITTVARQGVTREEISRRSGHVAGSRTLDSYIEQGERWSEDPLSGLL